MRVLGIESSCDELACAVLDTDGRTVLASVVHSQIEVHARFGGVVPEIASRDHVRQLGPVLQETLRRAELSLHDVDGIAVTAGPGLIGSLLCGVQFAKGLALAANKPLIGVHHLEGHLAATFLEDPAPTPPFVALLVSGGHTSLIRVQALGGVYEELGATRDDAAGEAFDKTAKLLGLGYPGGVAIDRLAQGGDAARFAFPQMMAGKDNFDFSFSGLKTAAAKTIRELGGTLEGQTLADFCASFQEAVVENLLKKSFRAASAASSAQLVLAGGVAANSRLRARALERGRREKLAVFLPSRANCTDNAQMIARAGWERLRRGEQSGLELSARASWPLFSRRAEAERT
jgi:N6-L-threonylcarbamoyladenine synthase